MERRFAITFPFDIEFEIFCYFINYLYYPIGFDESLTVSGWLTTQGADISIIKEILNRKVMIFIPPDDKEYDNVFITTFDNIGYKLSFNNKMQLLDRPAKKFALPDIDILQLSGREYIDFK